MIAPFNITQRYFEFFQDQVRSLFAEKEIKLDESATWWMKTLYLSCLYSVKIENNIIQDKGLFKIFQNWEAYPNGPVAVEPYQTFQQMSTLIGNFEKDDRVLEETDKTLIKHTVTNLFSNENYVKIASEKEQLINLTHSFFLWNDAVKFEVKKLRINNDICLKIEKKQFEKILN